MEENLAIIVFVPLPSDILVPDEWPICGVHRIVLDLIEDIIAEYDNEDSVLQVNGIPARIQRYVDQHGFFYVFKQIRYTDIYGMYIYDITFSEDINNNKMEFSSGISSEGFGPSDNCSCSGNYTVSCYRIPPRTHKCKTPDISDNESKVERMCRRILNKNVPHD